MKKIFAFLLALGLLAGCTQHSRPDTTQPTQPQQTQKPQAVTQAPQVDVLTLFSDRDYKTEYDKFVTVTLAGNTASCDSNAVRINGSTVTITDEGTYVLSGQLDGMVIVDAGKDDKTQLVLQNVQINNPIGAPL